MLLHNHHHFFMSTPQQDLYFAVAFEQIEGDDDAGREWNCKTAAPEVDTIMIARGGCFKVAVVERIEVFGIARVGRATRAINDDFALLNERIELLPETVVAHRKSPV